MALLERSVGSLTDVFPGSEMLEAVDEAERVGAKTVMIDKPIDSILAEIRNIPWLERLRIGFDVVAALFAMSTKKGTTQLAKGKFDDLMAEFNAKYPTLFRILVEERDLFMASRLQEILDHTTDPVVAVVGLGHLDGILKRLAANREAPNTNSVGVRYEWTLGAFPQDI